VNVGATEYPDTGTTTMLIINQPQASATK